ncbi:M56 family metallopeptidase [Prosthecobacter sp.]|uniref:M56 family metallopeptidase n=1 Tax=Prosthecobacter sp. TaxID=1965333 RepID=UPI003783849B
MNPLLYSVLDLLAKSAGIVLLAFATQHLWRNASAAQRCAVWLAAFAALLLLPFTQLWQPCWSIDFAQPEAQTPLPQLSPVVHAAAASEVVMPEYKAQSWLPTLSAMQWAACVWGAGCVWLLALRLLGSLQLRRLRAQTRLLEDGRVLACAARVARTLGLRRTVSLRTSSSVTVPLTWGIIQPVLLLPEHCLEWDEACLEAALRHEMGHIRHGDALTRLITTFITAVYWPNALVWLAAKAWRTTQEQAADDLVMSGGAVAENYALQLLDAARGVQAAGGLCAPVMAMAQPSTLETRLSAIMDGGRNRSSYSTRGAVTCLVLAFGALALCAAAQVRAAEEKPGQEAASPAGKLKDKANKLIIPSMKLKGASLEQAIAFLRQRAIELDPDHMGLNLNIEDPDFQKDAEISVDFISIPVSEALHYVSSLSHRVVRYEAAAIFISPENARAKMVTRSYKLPAGAAAKIGNARQWLTKQGVSFPEGAAVSLVGEDGSQLVIKNTEQELQNVEGLIEALAAGKTLAPPATVIPAAQPSPLEAKAAAIIIPQVQFQGVTVAEAVEFLRIKARELDPDKKGVSIIVRAEGVAPGTRISLDLRNVPLTEALKYTAELFGLGLTVEPYAMVLKARVTK